MKRYMKILSTIENIIMVSALVVMLGLTFLNVIIRKFTSLQFAFTEELVSPLFILVSLVGSAVLARTGGHIGLSVITDRLPIKFLKYSKLLVALVSVLFSAILLYFGIIMVIGEMRSGIITPSLLLPEWIFGLFVPIGALFMTLEFLNYGILAFNEQKSEEEG